MHSTVNFTGNILFLIFAAYIFSYAISFAGIGEKLTEFIVGMQLSTFQFYLALFVLFTVLGCLIESLGMIVITVPLLFPILGSYGIDPILFGVILVIYIELGQISPPIGINLFVIQSIWDGKLSEVVYGTIPFHLIMFVVLAMVIVWPGAVRYGCRAADVAMTGRHGMTRGSNQARRGRVGLRQDGPRHRAQSRSGAGASRARWDIAEAARTRAACQRGVALCRRASSARSKSVLFVVPGSAQIDAMLAGGLLARPHHGRNADRSHHLASGGDASATRRAGPARRAATMSTAACPAAPRARMPAR